MRNLTDNDIKEMFRTDAGKMLYSKVAQTIEKHGMKDMLGSGVLVGLSGGADSVLLLCVMLEYRRRCGCDFTVACLHINHMIRGTEADADEEFCRSLCKGLCVELLSVKCDVPKLAKDSGIGVEEAARDVRYSAFADLLQSRNDISCIATAHSATDNIETVLINMLRGSGICGMCGIPPVRDNIIRPLIAISSDEIRSLLGECGVAFVVDSTNLSDEYTRNYIRHNILPHMRHICNDPETAIGRMCDNLRDVQSLISDETEMALASIGDISHFNIKHIRNIQSALFASVMSRIIGDATGKAPMQKHIKAIYDQRLKDNFTVSVSGEYDFVVQRGECLFLPKRRRHCSSETDDVNNSSDSHYNKVFCLHEGVNRFAELGLTVIVDSPCDDISLNIYKFSIQQTFKSDIIKGELFIRFKRDGDSYCYGGQRKKLKKLFNDRGISPYLRERIPILCDGAGILWVPGFSVRDGAGPGKAPDPIRITLAIDEADDSKCFFIHK